MDCFAFVEKSTLFWKDSRDFSVRLVSPKIVRLESGKDCVFQDYSLYLALMEYHELESYPGTPVERRGLQINVVLPSEFTGRTEFCYSDPLEAVSLGFIPAQGDVRAACKKFPGSHDYHEMVKMMSGQMLVGQSLDEQFCKVLAWRQGDSIIVLKRSQTCFLDVPGDVVVFATRLEELVLPVSRMADLPKPILSVPQFQPLNPTTQMVFHEWRSEGGSEMYTSASPFLNWIYVPLLVEDFKLQKCWGKEKCLTAQKRLLLFGIDQEFWFGDGLFGARDLHATLDDFLARDFSSDKVRVERLTLGRPALSWSCWGSWILKRRVSARLMNGLAGTLGYVQLTVIYEAVRPRIPTCRLQKMSLHELASTRHGSGGPYFVTDYDSRTVGRFDPDTWVLETLKFYFSRAGIWYSAPYFPGFRFYLPGAVNLSRAAVLAFADLDTKIKDLDGLDGGRLLRTTESNDAVRYRVTTHIPGIWAA